MAKRARTSSVTLQCWSPGPCNSESDSVAHLHLCLTQLKAGCGTHREEEVQTKSRKAFAGIFASNGNLRSSKTNSTIYFHSVSADTLLPRGKRRTFSPNNRSLLSLPIGILGSHADLCAEYWENILVFTISTYHLLLDLTSYYTHYFLLVTFVITCHYYFPLLVTCYYLSRYFYYVPLSLTFSITSCHLRVTYMSLTCHLRVTYVSLTCHRVTYVSLTCHLRVTYV